MPKTFAEALSLNDAWRTSLNLSTTADWKIYSDYAEVLPRLTQLLDRDERAPKLLVFGGWGTGKSQLLRHTANMLLPKTFAPVYIELTGLTARTSFLDIYRLIYGQIEKQLLENLKSGPDWDRFNWGRFELPNVVHDAIKALQRELKLKIVPDPRKLAQLRAWFTGQSLTLAATLNLSLSARLLDYSSPSVLVALLRAFSQYASKCDQPGYMLFFDESATRALSRDYIQVLNALNEGFRSLADPSNEDLGVMFAVNTVPGRPPLLRNDVLQRLQGTTIELPPMRTPAQVSRFIKGLNDAMASRPWFEEAALMAFSDGALQTGAAPETPGQLTPRDVLHLLQLVGERASISDLPMPLSEDLVRPMFPPSVRSA